MRAPLFVFTCLAVSVALFLYQHAWRTKVEPFQYLAGQRAQVQALMLDYPEERYHRYYYRLQVQQIDGQDVEPFVLRLSAAQPLSCRPYDLVSCPVSFFNFETGGPYSQQNLRLAGGYQLGAYLAGAGGTGRPSTRFYLGRLLAELRHMAGRTFSQLLPPEDAAFLQAMLIGRRDGLPEESYTDFQILGCSHLLVISGLHMGLLSRSVSRAGKALGLRRRPLGILTAAALLLFLCIAGFPVSGLRACVMQLTYLLGSFLGQRADSVNSLGLALLLICLQDPFSGGDLGLALSAFATLGILTLGQGLSALFLSPLAGCPALARLLRPAASVLAMTLSAMAFTLPWQVLAWGSLPLFSPLANLLLGPACTLLLYGAFLIALLSLSSILTPLAQPVALFTGWAARYARWVARQLGRIPGASLHLGPVALTALCGMLLLFTLLCLAGPGPYRRRITTACTAILLAWSCLWAVFPGRGLVTIAVAGDSDALTVVLIKDRRAAVLSLGGLDSQGAALLARHNVLAVDTLFLPQTGSTQRQSAQQVMRRYPVGQVLLPADRYQGREFSSLPVGEVSPGSRFSALDMEIHYTQDGKRLCFYVGEVSFIVEFEPSGPGRCTYLITNNTETEINSAFTVLPPDGIIGEDTARPGAYLLPGTEDGLYLTADPQGRVAVKEGN